MTPEWPCPYCGHESWTCEPVVHRVKPPLTPCICGHCRVLFTPHWVDGAWMGRYREASRGESLAEFIDRRSEELRRDNLAHR